MTRPKAAPKKHAGRKRKAADALDENEPTPYTITCPALPLNKRAKRGDYFQDFDDPGDEKLKVQYTIEPGSRWSDMKSYRKMKYKEHEFKQGDFIFVNRDSAIGAAETDAVLSDLNEEELLEWHRQHTWIGRIQQVKAARADEVYIRVFWFYWPEELPHGGREPYHGKREVVLSNHAEIVDSTTISSAADIKFWDEEDDRDGPSGQLYWRQTIDFNKSGQHGRAGLSKPRKHCKCEQPHHPDKTMYQCSYNGCASWNHQHCLEDELLERLEVQLKNGNLEDDLDKRAKHLHKKQQDHKLSIGERITVGAENLFNRIQGTMLAHHHNDGGLKKDAEVAPASENGVDRVNKKEEQIGRQDDGEVVDEESAPREKGRLTVTVKRKGTTKNVAAEVRLVPAKGTKKGTVEGQEKIWEIQLDCLKCGHPLD